MIDELGNVINISLNRLIASQRITLNESLELRTSLSYLAFNLTAAKSVRKYFWEVTSIDLPDAVEKEKAATWLFHILQSGQANTAKEPKATDQETITAVRLLQWAEEADLIVQTERLVFFRDPMIQNYFCAHACSKQLLDPILLQHTSTRFQQVWPLWSELDLELISKLLTMLNTTFDRQLHQNIVKILAFIGSVRAVEPLINVLNISKEQLVRAEICETLGKLGDSRAIEVLVGLMQNKSESELVRFSAAKALTQYGDLALPFLIAALTDSDINTRKLATKAVAEFNNLEAVTLLTSRLIDDREGQVRAAAAIALGKIPGYLADYAIKFLLKALNDPSEEVRANVVTTLGQIGDTTVTEPLSILLKDGYVGVRYRVAEALARLGDVKVVPVLITALSDINERVREKVVQALGCIGDRLAFEPLLSKLRDETEIKDVRLACIISLGKIRDVRAVELLVYTLRHESEDSWRSLVALALGEIGDTRAFEPLIDMLEDKSNKVRGDVAIALGKLGDIHALDYLIELLKDQNSKIRSKAAIGLGILSDKRAVGPLINALKDKVAEVRYDAAIALGKLGDKTALPYLQWLQQNDLGRTILGEQVRYAATVAIERIKSKLWAKIEGM